ncbi:hypothetical protein HK096_010264, partial [Nowakowskiella sp. JEL0078]
MKLNYRFESSVFSVDIKVGQTVDDLKKEIFKQLANVSVAADDLIVLRVFETDSNLGVDQHVDLSEMARSVLGSLARGVDIEGDRKFEFKITGFEWKSHNGEISAKVLSPGGKCASYGLARDSLDSKVDVVVIIPDSLTRETASR